MKQVTFNLADFIFRGSQSTVSYPELKATCEADGWRLPSWKFDDVDDTELEGLACQDPAACPQPPSNPGLDTDYDGRGQTNDSFRYFCDSQTKGMCVMHNSVYFMIFVVTVHANFKTPERRYFKFRQSGATRETIMLKFRVLPFKQVFVHFTNLHQYLEFTPGSKEFLHYQDPEIEINGKELIFGKLDPEGKFYYDDEGSFNNIDLQENVGHDFFVLIRPGNELKIESLDINVLTELGKFDYENLDDFNFIGFSSGQQETHWIVEQSQQLHCLE